MAVFSLDDTPAITHKLNIGTTNILNIEPEVVFINQIQSVTKSSGLTLNGVTRPTIDFVVKDGAGLSTQTRWYFRNDDSEANRNTIWDKVNDVIANDLNSAT